MDMEPNPLEQFCRRQWRMRTDAVRQCVDRRRESMMQIAGPLSDREKTNRDLALRMLRAKGTGSSEAK